MTQLETRNESRGVSELAPSLIQPRTLFTERLQGCYRRFELSDTVSEKERA